MDVPTLMPFGLTNRPVAGQPSAHLIGGCGTGMKALGEMLLGLGYRVTGSEMVGPQTDSATATFERLAIRIGHTAANISPYLSCAVYSPAVPAENVERMECRRLGIPLVSYNDMVGQLMRSRRGVCVAGTHGKSTTTALVASLFEAGGLAPAALFGAERLIDGASGWAGQSSWMVAESCEFQNSFHSYTPELAAILNIEPDHFDCFHSEAELAESFAGFAQRVLPGGLLAVPYGQEHVEKVGASARCAIETFGLHRLADWYAEDLRPCGTGTRFRVYRKGQFFTEAIVGIGGQHNVQNALAAIVLAAAAGVNAAGIREGLLAFQGLRRRFEVLGTWRGMTLVDDYAHHPTAVRATLETARARFGGRKLWCVFQPHQVSRLRALLDEFAESLTLADEVLISPVFAARETVTTEPQEWSAKLSDEVARRGVHCRFVSSLDRVSQTLETGLRSGDVAFTMGAGDIYQVHYEFIRRLSRNSSSGRAARPVHLAEAGWSRSVLPHTA